MATRRISGGAGLLFKGSGFYLTDYGKNAHRRPAPDAARGDGKAAEGKPESAKADAGKSSSDSAAPAAAAKSESSGKSESASQRKPKGGTAE
jgi:predicted nucleic acid-binding Zn ribbon protein